MNSVVTRQSGTGDGKFMRTIAFLTQKGGERKNDPRGDAYAVRTRAKE